MNMRIALVLSFFIILTGPSFCIAQFESIGFVKTVAGEVYIITPDTTIRAVPYMKINQGDSVKTTQKSSVGLIFKDDTVISLGPRSQIEINAFLFNPAKKELSFIAKLIQGTFSILSGQIVKLAPNKVKLETPDATLGVRGTRLLVKVE